MRTSLGLENSNQSRKSCRTSVQNAKRRSWWSELDNQNMRICYAAGRRGWCALTPTSGLRRETACRVADGSRTKVQNRLRRGGQSPFVARTPQKGTVPGGSGTVPGGSGRAATEPGRRIHSKTKSRSKNGEIPRQKHTAGSTTANFVFWPPRRQAAKFAAQKPRNPREKQQSVSRSAVQSERFLRSGRNKIIPRLAKNSEILRENRPLVWNNCPKRKKSPAMRDSAKFARPAYVGLTHRRSPTGACPRAPRRCRSCCWSSTSDEGVLRPSAIWAAITSRWLSDRRIRACLAARRPVCRRRC